MTADTSPFARTAGALRRVRDACGAGWQWAFPAPPHLTETLQRRQCATLFRQAPIMAAVNLVLAVLLTVAVWQSAPPALAMGWCGAAILIVGRQSARLFARRRAPSGRTPPSIVLRRAAFGGAVIGLLWGAAGLAFFATGDAAVRTVLAIVLAGLAAGIVAALACFPRIALTYILLSLPPLLVQFALEGSRISLVLVAMGLTFLAAIVAGLRIGYMAFYRGVVEGHRAETAEKRLRDSIESLNDGFVLFGADGRLVEHNTRFVDYLSYLKPCGSIVGMSFERIVRLSLERGFYADDQDIMRDPGAWIEGALARFRSPPPEPWERRLPDGRTVLHQFHKIADGSTVGLITDITGVKRAEERLMRAIESMSDGFVLYDAEDRVVLHNRRHVELYLGLQDFASIVGKKRGALLAHGWKRGLFAPEAYRGTMQDWLDRQSAVMREPEQPVFERRMADGRTLLTRGQRTADGGLLVITTDITALKRAEARLTDAVDSLSEGIALWDAGDRLVLHNRAYAALFEGVPEALKIGESYETVLRASIAAGVFPVAAGREEEYIRERLAQRSAPNRSAVQAFRGGRWLKRTEYRTSEGGLVTVRVDVTESAEREAALTKSRAELAVRVDELEAVKFKLQAQSVEMRMLFRQLAQTRDQAQAASRAKSVFLANMSHELRTPLNAIIGFSEIMQIKLFGPLGDARYEGYAGDMLGAARHLLKLINDILDISKIEAGKWELKEEPVLVPALFADVVRLFKDRAGAAKIALAVEAAPDLPALHADERALKQVLINALSNAIKFTPAGGRVRLRAQIGGRGFLHIAIGDTGVGMKREDLPRALAPFSQVDNRLARSHEGTGLGLSIAKALVELHGGLLRIRSRPERGTVVLIALPPRRLMHKGEAPPNRLRAA